MLKNQKGVTLLEVLASTVILSLVVIGFITISNFGLVTNKNSDRSADAMNIAEEILNNARTDIKTTGAWPTRVTPPTRDVFSAKIQYAPINFTNPNVNYDTSLGTRHVSLQAIVWLHAQPNLLTVTVSWSG
jgi:prepilin-type N-terminal cleavage/methylation domain-containing protein